MLFNVSHNVFCASNARDSGGSQESELHTWGSHSKDIVAQNVAASPCSLWSALEKRPTAIRPALGAKFMAPALSAQPRFAGPVKFGPGLLSDLTNISER